MGICGQVAVDGRKKRGFLFACGLRHNGRILFSLNTQVQQKRRVTAVVEDHVGKAFVIPLKDAVGVFPVVVERLTLDGKHRHAVSGDRGRCMVLRGEDVAGSPADLSTQSRECFNEYRRLNGHVKRTGNTGASQRFLTGILLADCHQAGHFSLGNGDFLAAPVGQVHVGNDILRISIHGEKLSEVEVRRNRGRRQLKKRAVSTAYPRDAEL